MRTNGFAGLVGRYGTILIDPPWRFANRTGKMAPEHKRLRRYPTMSFEEISSLPVDEVALPKSHLYMWCPNALLLEAPLNLLELCGQIHERHVRIHCAHGFPDRWDRARRTQGR